MSTRSFERTIEDERGPQAGFSLSPWVALSTEFWRGNPELLLSVVTLVALIAGWLGGSVSGFLPRWLVVAMALVAYAAGGYSGVKCALACARKGILNIDFLMIAAALGAAFIGEWEEGALLLFLFSLSGAMESYASDRTRQAISRLAELRPDTAWVRYEGEAVEQSIDSLAIGDVVVVRPGERMPVDGTVLQGTTHVDQSPITGESMQVFKSAGDAVFSGTINGSGAIDVEVTKLASESTISKIIGLVEEAQDNAAPTQQFIDRFSQPYTLAVIGATVLAILLPFIFGSEPFDRTLYRAMTLLVVASPCALIISTPASILSAIAAGARGGVLFKGGAYLEKAADLDLLAFDKTGTLTHGKHRLTDVVPLRGYSEAEVISLAAGAESLSEHPIGRAVLKRAQELDLAFEAPQDFRGIAGHGVQAFYSGNGREEVVYVGNAKLFMSETFDLPEEVRRIGRQLQKEGKTAILVLRRGGLKEDLGAWATELGNEAQFGRADSEASGKDWEAVGFIAVSDMLRTDAAETVAKLKDMGVARLAMLTGDNRDVAEAIAAEVGLQEVYPELLPEQKVEIVETLRESGTVAMVGDGINDAPALAASDLGIAMGGAGTDVALETADIVLMSDDLGKLPFVLRLSRRAREIVRQNIYVSVAAILTLVVMTVLAPIVLPGFRLPLPVGVLGHEGSTLIVVANGLRMLIMRPE
ncbi:MAG: heavy metal translocating P-type ATPase [Caldilineaceae bacterium]|nr:heavy metal translocating P-type ATPase [Caldilineaceae bacterium]MDE0068622.1 heavy metal translocating P-type ATPase [Caldilineaceae bacterium]MDE0430398.1 heavy metal translocating P-type ATPase [Caldilineaceae bacterium]